MNYDEIIFFLQCRIDDLRIEIDHGNDDDIFLGNECFADSISKKNIHDSLVLELDSIKEIARKENCNFD